MHVAFCTHNSKKGVCRDGEMKWTEDRVATEKLVLVFFNVYFSLSFSLVLTSTYRATLTSYEVLNSCNIICNFPL